MNGLPALRLFMIKDSLFSANILLDPWKSLKLCPIAFKKWRSLKISLAITHSSVISRAQSRSAYLRLSPWWQDHPARSGNTMPTSTLLLRKTFLRETKLNSLQLAPIIPRVWIFVDHGLMMVNGPSNRFMAQNCFTLAISCNLVSQQLHRFEHDISDLLPQFQSPVGQPKSRERRWPTVPL